MKEMSWHQRLKARCSCLHLGVLHQTPGKGWRQAGVTLCSVPDPHPWLWAGLPSLTSVQSGISSLSQGRDEGHQGLGWNPWGQDQQFWYVGQGNQVLRFGGNFFFGNGLGVGWGSESNIGFCHLDSTCSVS